MRLAGTMRTAATLAAVLTTVITADALACSGKGCKEAPPPGVTLQVYNPYGLAPLSGLPSAGQPLWPRVNGHKPYGFNAVSAGDDGTTWADEATIHQVAGASMARVGVDFASVRTTPDEWDYSKIDEAYRHMVARGVRPLFSVRRTPKRFTRHHLTTGYVQGCEGDLCWTPPMSSNVGQLNTFAKDLVRRYPLGAGVEVWNEPNWSNPFWGSDPPDPELYAKMLAAVHDGVKAVSPAWPVIGGSLAATTTDVTTGTSQYLSVTTFVRRLLAAGGAAKMDALAIHPYVGAYRTDVTDEVRSYLVNRSLQRPHESILAGYEAAGKPMNERLVITEYGASTTDGWSPETQANVVAYQYYTYDVNHPNIPLSDRVDAAFAHRAVENPDPLYGNTYQTGFGWVQAKDATGAFVVKPVLCEFRRLFAGQPDCPATITP